MVNWTGNLKDDCRADWQNIYLHCEELNSKTWWWAIYDDEHTEIDSSNNHEEIARSGKAARTAAELAATKHLEDKPSL